MYVLIGKHFFLFILEFLKNKLKFSRIKKKRKKTPRGALHNDYAVCFFFSSLIALPQWFFKVNFLIGLSWEIVRNEDSLSPPHSDCSQWFSDYPHVRVTEGLSDFPLSSAPRVSDSVGLGA